MLYVTCHQLKTETLFSQILILEGYNCQPSTHNDQISDQILTKTGKSKHKLWVLVLEKRYGLWSIRELWVFQCFSVGTTSVEAKMYGLMQSMGYDRYGLRQSRLYHKDRRSDNCRINKKTSEAQNPKGKN